MPTVVLASASPARLATLRAAGIEPTVIVSGVDEDQYGDLAPPGLALRLAELKCAAVAARADLPGDALVVGCDSVLELDGEALGKPGTPQVATARWRAMRGRTAVLHTGHAVADVSTGRTRSAAAATEVDFADITDAEIEAYVATGEPLQVAGAFTIDGIGGAYVTAIRGDHHNVVGLSLPVLRTLVGELGHAWHELWRGGASPA